jgi:acetyltransferase-like isoleucine patch superfamily enzyme
MTLIWRIGLRIRDSVCKYVWRFCTVLKFRSSGVACGPDLTVYGLPIISLSPGSKIVLGRNLVLCSHSRFTALGVARPVIIRTLRSSAQIILGNNVGLSGTVICAALSVEIGDDCLIGADVTIFDTDFHALAAEGRRHNSDPSQIVSAPVKIGSNVFIGTGSIICKGVTVGDHAVIGAGSVVTSDIAACAVVAGNPARLIRILAA